MIATDTRIDTDTIVELVGDMVCSDAFHALSQSAHVASQPGEYVLIAPCCGMRTILCKGRAYYLKYISAEIHCTSCDQKWAPGRYRFLPVHPGVSPL